MVENSNDNEEDREVSGDTDFEDNVEKRKDDFERAQENVSDGEADEDDRSYIFYWEGLNYQMVPVIVSLPAKFSNQSSISFN